MEYSGKDLGKFIEAWNKLDEPRQCFIDLNKVARCWTGDQNRFGDCPGRSFGFDHILRSLMGDNIRHRLYSAVGEDVTDLSCLDCGREFVPEKLPPEGFIGLFQSFFRCPDHNRGYSGEFECPPESPMDRRKLRRRIEDALRKSATDADLIYIADRLNVRI